METKEVNLKNMTVSLQEIQESYEYIDPVLNRTFTEFKEPVIDSDGFLREKSDPHVDKSLYRKNVVSHERIPVNIIESVDIKNIQKDFQGIENKYDEMLRMFSIVMGKVDDQTKLIIDQNRKIDDLTKRLDEKDKTIELQNKIIANRDKTIEKLNKRLDDQEKSIEDFKKSSNESIKAANYKIEVQDDKLAIQSAQMANYEKMFNKQDKKLEDAKKEIVKFANENARLRHDIFHERLDNSMEQEKEETISLIYRNKNKKRRISDSDDMINESDLDNVPLIKKESIGLKWNPATGIRDTFSIFTPKTFLHQQKYENELRKSASSGDIVRVKDLIGRFPHIVNGRGMPDSICSRVSSFYDKTALMLAAQEGHLECVKFLIANEADVNFVDRDSFTALDYAQQYLHKDVTDFLKQHLALNGADVVEAIRQKELDDLASEFELMQKKIK